MTQPFDFEIFIKIIPILFAAIGAMKHIKVSLPLLSILHSPSIMRPVDPVSAQPSIVLQTSLD